MVPKKWPPKISCPQRDATAPTVPLLSFIPSASAAEGLTSNRLPGFVNPIPTSPVVVIDILSWLPVCNLKKSLAESPTILEAPVPQVR